MESINLSKNNLALIGSAEFMSGSSAEQSEARRVFEDKIEILNTHAANKSAVAGQLALRPFIQRPLVWPGSWAYGCGLCFMFVHSAEFQAWQDHCEEIATKQAFCRLQVRAIPKRCNLECHIESGLHEMASRWYTCLEITNVRPEWKSPKMA